jgi:hypothetical protein
MEKYFVRPHSSFYPDLLIDDSTDRISRELWWTNQDFPLSISFHHGSLSPGG